MTSHDQRPLLQVDNLNVAFENYRSSKTRAKTELVRIISNLSFAVYPGETVAIVGESGSGKSVTALSLMRLLRSPPLIVESGSIFFNGVDILQLKEKEMQKIRGKEMGIIFQDPMTSLNPTLTIGKQMREGFYKHEKISSQEADHRVVEMLQLVGISEAKKRMNQYPHEFSGGMRQRVMIAIALLFSPKLLIADEPTTALDVTIQAQILELMKKIQAKTKTSIILITHDLGIVAGMADRVLVMYAGKIVEKGSVEAIFSQPAHPYTQALLRSLPRLDMDKNKKLIPIDGSPPRPLNRPPGCPFSPRCPKAMRICELQPPPTLSLPEGGEVACWLEKKSTRIGNE